MRNRIALLVSLLLIGVIAIAWGAAPIVRAQDDTPVPQTTPRTLTANGSGQVFLTPDIAYINIGVRTDGKVASEAVASNNETADKVVQALRGNGIDAKDIRTSNFSIYPQQQYNEQGQPGEITYVVENSLYVTVRKLDEIGDVLDSAVEAGANSIYGITFDVSNKAQLLGDAREAAVANAQQVAQELAQAAGVTLGEVQSLTSYSGGYPAPMYSGMGGVVAREAAASVPVSAGELSFTVEVTMVFEIR